MGAGADAIGSVSVKIVGDASSLQSSFTAATQSATRAGETIGNAFNAAAIRQATLQLSVDTLRQKYDALAAQGVRTAAGQQQMENTAARLAIANAKLSSALAPLPPQLDHVADSTDKVTHSMVTGQQATSGFIRTIEGSGGLRAVENFLAKTLGLGPAMQAIFPLVGALAFAEILGHIASKLSGIGDAARDAKEKNANAWNELSATFQKDNDQLDLTNAKLDEQIAKLSGHHENALAALLAEAKIAADELNASLEKGIKDIGDLLEKQKLGALENVISGGSVGQVGSSALQNVLTGKSGVGGQYAEFQRLADEEAKVLEGIKQAGAGASSTGAQYTTTEEYGVKFSRKQSTEGETGSRYTAAGATPQRPEQQAAAVRKLYGEKQVTALESVQSGIQHILTTPEQLSQLSAREIEQFEYAARALQQKIDGIRKSITEEDQKETVTKLTADKANTGEDKKGIEDARALAVAKIEAQEKALNEGSALDKLFNDNAIKVSHSAVVAQIAGMTDRREAAVAEAEEELRVAKAHQAEITEDLRNNTAARIALIREQGAAESQGKTPVEQQTIGIKTEEKVSEVGTRAIDAETAAAAAVAEAQYAVNAAQAASARERDLETLKAIGKELDQNNERVLIYKNLSISLKEISQKGSGQEADLAATRQKLELERQYTLEAGHSKQQDIDYATEIAAIEERARQAKIAGLKSEQATAQATVNAPGTSDEERANQAKVVARLQTQIADLQEQSANANFAAQTKILETIQAQNQALQAQKTILDALANWSEISVGTAANQFAHALVSVPQQIGDSLAKSIFTPPKKGESKGAEIGQGLVKTTEKAGEGLAGQLIGDAIKKLIAQLIGQAAIDAIQNSITAANTAALSVQTAAMGVLSAALIANTTSNYARIATLGFAGGGDPATDRPFLAGEQGPELIHPKGQSLTVVPAGKTKQIMEALSRYSLSSPDTFTPEVPGSIASNHAPRGGSYANTITNNSNVGNFGNNHYHIYGAQNPREIMRQIADFEKRQTGKYSPANS